MDDIFKGAPYLIQFAKNGEYENAWKISLLDSSPPTYKEVKNYVSKGDFETLAVEFFWHGSQKDTDDVITVLYNDTLQVNEEFFVKRMLQGFYESLDFSELVDFIDKHIIGFQFLFKIPMDFARVGVVDFWFSEGPIDIWQRGNEINKEELLRKLETNPKVLKSTKNYQAMARIFNFEGNRPGPYHIIHSVCTKKNGKTWELDKEKLYKDLVDFTKKFS